MKLFGIQEDLCGNQLVDLELAGELQREQNKVIVQFVGLAITGGDLFCIEGVSAGWVLAADDEKVGEVMAQQQQEVSIVLAVLDAGVEQAEEGCVPVEQAHCVVAGSCTLLVDVAVDVADGLYDAQWLLLMFLLFWFKRQGKKKIGVGG